MKKYLLYFMTVALATFLLSACKKDSSHGTDSAQALFSGQWKLVKYEQKSSDSSWVQTSPPGYMAGISFSFQSNGTRILYSDGVQYNTDSYRLSDNNQTIDMGGGTYHISILNSTTLQLIDFAYNDRQTYGH
jgi:hypothetical protein